MWPTKAMDLIEKYDLKTAFDVSNRVLCLPLYPDLETWIVDRITDKIISMFWSLITTLKTIQLKG